MKYTIHTFGCQMNKSDSERLASTLENLGYTATEKMEDSDLIIFNTCTIREKAYHKAISEIGRSRDLKKHHPDKLIAICGCVAQQDGNNIMEKYPEIDLVFGPDQIHKLPIFLDALKNRERPAALDLINNPDEYIFIDETPSQVLSGNSFVTIMKGCNCACSYCIVPSVRGREVSRPVSDIITEINSLVQVGAKEITLLGQNVTAYKYKNVSLAGLIKNLSIETNIQRIRFTSPHPKDVDEKLIAEFSSNKKLCPHIHLPIQSASNTVLKRMKRGYTKEKYLEIVYSLRAACNDISITSDFIVGFCGETEEEFTETMDLLNHLQLDSVFAFKYSTRPNTYAAENLADDIPKEIKEERLERLLSLQREITLNKNNQLIGNSYDILVTGFDRKKTGKLMGRLANNKIVNFTGNHALIGDIVSIKVVKAYANSVEGLLNQ